MATRRPIASHSGWHRRGHATYRRGIIVGTMRSRAPGGNARTLWSSCLYRTGPYISVYPVERCGFVSPRRSYIHTRGVSCSRYSIHRRQRALFPRASCFGLANCFVFRHLLRESTADGIQKNDGATYTAGVAGVHLTPFALETYVHQ